MHFTCSLVSMSPIVTSLHCGRSKTPFGVGEDAECPSQGGTPYRRCTGIKTQSLLQPKVLYTSFVSLFIFSSLSLWPVRPSYSKLFTTETYRHVWYQRISYHFHPVFLSICSRPYGPNHCFCLCSFTEEPGRTERTERGSHSVQGCEKTTKNM